jgi:hypothetical protein
VCKMDLSALQLDWYDACWVHADVVWSISYLIGRNALQSGRCSEESPTSIFHKDDCNTSIYRIQGIASKKLISL